LIVDRILVAANSAVAAVDRLKQVNPKSIKFLSLLAALEGIDIVLGLGDVAIAFIALCKLN
jgi:uracil phosphoribosyltransferase